MNITIETIPHAQQRYPTAGDWKFDQHGDLLIRVSKLSDWRRESLIAIHELVEVVLCKNAGISQEDVDRFDINFENRRNSDSSDEPGDDPAAPYVRQHCIATSIERLLAAEFGVSWKEYEEEINALP